MQPDVAADCDTTPVLIVAAVVSAGYMALAVLFFRAKLNGVD